MSDIYIGKNNSTFQHLAVIKNNKQKRQDFNEFFVEGVRNIDLAIKYGWKIKNWIYSSERTLSNWAKDKIKNIKTEKNYLLSSELVNVLSGKTDVSELMAIVEIKKFEIDTFKKQPLLIVLDRISKKGNLGTIIRSADAFGVDGIIVTGHAVDIYDSEVISATMGSYFAMPIKKIETKEEIISLINCLKEKYKDLQVLATFEKGEIKLADCDLKKPTIFLMGNERFGLSRFYVTLADRQIQIPMSGEASSLNVGCATSICLYETFIKRAVK